MFQLDCNVENRLTQKSKRNQYLINCTALLACQSEPMSTATFRNGKNRGCFAPFSLITAFLIHLRFALSRNHEG